MRSGDEELGGAEEFIERNWSKMVRIAKAELLDKKCVSPDVHAEDIAANVRLALLENWNELNAPQNAMYVFLARSARAHARKCRHESLEEVNSSAVPLFSKPSMNPEQTLEAAELLDQALSLLNEDEKEIITSRYFLDMSFISIADLLGKPIGTIISIHGRALKKMRNITDRVIKSSPAIPSLGRDRIQKAVRSIVHHDASTENFPN